MLQKIVVNQSKPENGNSQSQGNRNVDINNMFEYSVISKKLCNEINKENKNKQNWLSKLFQQKKNADICKITKSNETKQMGKEFLKSPGSSFSSSLYQSISLSSNDLQRYLKNSESSSLSQELVSGNNCNYDSDHREENQTFLSSEVELAEKFIHMKFNLLKVKHITSLCLSNNGLVTLDVTSLTSLTSLRSHDNELRSLSLHGALLTNLDVARNDLSTLVVRYTPRQLIDLNMSRNSLIELPSWLEQCEDLKTLDLSRNNISKIPNWLPLPNLINLSLHHNKITEIPAPNNRNCVFYNQQNLNLSKDKNNLELPPPTPPRMPILNPLKYTKQLSTSTNNLRSQLQFKRPAPPPPSSDNLLVTSHIIPPPQFLTNSEKEKFQIQGSHSKLLSYESPPPVPPLPPHLRQNNTGEQHSYRQHREVEKETKGYEDEDHYEECEIQREGDKVYQLEMFLLHHNRLKTLPTKLMECLTKLKILNVSNNQLVTIYGEKKSKPTKTSASPTSTVEFPQFSFHGERGNSEKILMNLEEFYGGCNSLCSLDELEKCPKLKILHAPYNELKTLSTSLITKTQQLEEIVLAGNIIQQLPDKIKNLNQLRLLRVNSNPLIDLPSVRTLQNIKVIDASHCRLIDLEIQKTVSPSLVLLDLSENPSLRVDPSQMTLCRSTRFVNVAKCSKDRNGHREDGNQKMNRMVRAPSDVCTIGFAECIGQQKRLFVSQLRHQNIIQNSNCSYNLFGVAEENVDCNDNLQTERSFSNTNTNNSLPEDPTSKRVLKDVSEMFRDNFEDHDDLSLKYSILSALRKQHIEGSRQPKCLSLLKLQVSKITGHKKTDGLIFKVSAEFCGFGASSAMIVSELHKPHMVTSSVRKDGDNETCFHFDDCCEKRSISAPSNGPVTLPDPESKYLELNESHSAIVLASQSLWSALDHHEVNQICLRTPDPSLAARRLLTLAQSYGSKSSINVIVVGLNHILPSKLKGTEKNFSENHSNTISNTTRLAKNAVPILSLNGSSLGIDQFPTFKKLKKNATLKKMRALVHHNDGKHESSDEETPADRAEYKARKSLDRKIKKTSTSNNKLPLDNPSKLDSNALNLTNKPNEIVKTLKTMKSKQKLKDKLPDNFFNSYVGDRVQEFGINSASHSIFPDRSSPSGQSCSDDISIILREEKNEDKPVWPGQLGPVSPSGPFAINLNPKDEIGHLTNCSSEITSGFRNNFKLCDLSSNSDNLFLKRRSNSRASSGIKSPSEFRDNELVLNDINTKQNSVPVFRPFYHFPSPNSLSLLNKSNATKSDYSNESNFTRGSTKGGDVARSSFIAKKLKHFNKLRRGISVEEKSMHDLNSDSDFSQFRTIAKQQNTHYTNGSESERAGEEQLRSFEYLMARNSKLMLSKDMEDARDSRFKNFNEQRKYLEHTRSVPDLVKASKENDSEDDVISKTPLVEKSSPRNSDEMDYKSSSHSHFQKGTARRSRFGSGTIRVLQHRLANTSTKIPRTNSIANQNKIDDTSIQEGFRRFGSLQNLGNYQNKQTNNNFDNDVISSKLKSTLEAKGFGSLASIRLASMQSQQQLAEMQERRSVDSSMELESRMSQYWLGATTCF